MKHKPACIALFVAAALQMGCSPSNNKESMAAEYNHAVTAFRNGDTATALSKVQDLANRGYPEAQVTLGKFNLFGHAGVPKNEAKAVELFRLAAAQGNTEAQSGLADAYFEGKGVDRNADEGKK